MPKTQNRQQRETNRREAVELKSEIRNLKKQNNRLKKQLNLLSDAEIAAADEMEATDTMSEPVQRECPKCESTDIGTWTTPTGKVLLGCRKCKKWRGSL